MSLALNSPIVWSRLFALGTKICNTLWADALSKELENVKAAFKLTRWEVQCHMVCDIKMDNVGNEDSFVTRSHTTKVPATVTFASIVSQEMSECSDDYLPQ